MVSAPTANRRAAIYTRISRDSSGDGEGVERQEALCRDLAERIGVEVVNVYVDNDIGASDKTNKNKVRTEYAKLLADARTGNIGYILAYSNSRLTRRMSELEELITLTEVTEASFGKGNGVKFHTVVSGNDDLSTEDGKFAARIKASMDASEAGRISERSKAAHRSKALKGIHKKTPWRAFGFMDDGVTHNPAEAQLIREAVDKVIAGASIRQIGKGWEELGVTSTRGTLYWGHSRLKDALFSWKVAGVRAYNGEPLEDAHKNIVMGEWEPIITLEKREQALLELDTHYAKPKRREGKWLLSGLLRCGKCGRPLYGNHGGETRASAYICSNGRSAHLGIKAEPLEEYIERVVHRYILDRAIHGEEQAEVPVVVDWPNETRLATVAEKIEELMDAFNTGKLSGGIVFAQVEKLDQERRELNADRARYYASKAPQPRELVERSQAWKMYRRGIKAPFEERRLTLRREVESIAIFGGKQGSRKYADFEARIKINWVEPHPEFNGRSAEDAAKEPLSTVRLAGEKPRPRSAEEMAEWEDAMKTESASLDELEKLPFAERNFD